MVTVEGMSVMSVMSLDAASISARCCVRQTYLKPKLNRCRNEENDAPNFTEAWTGGDCQADASVLRRRAWFDAHPDETEYIRDFAPGEFPAEELPVPPPGFTYATRVTVIIRNEHGAVGRYRELMMVSSDWEALKNLPEEWKRRNDLRFCGWK